MLKEFFISGFINDKTNLEKNALKGGLNGWCIQNFSREVGYNCKANFVASKGTVN